MKKRLLIGILSLVLVIAFIAGACATPAPTTTQPTTTAPPATTATPQVIELKWACTSPPVVPLVKRYDAIIKQIEEASNGRVKITLFSSGSLLQAPEMVDGVIAGVADIGEVWPVAQQIRLNLFYYLLWIGWPDTQEKATELYREMLATYPPLMDEFKGLKVLWPTAWGATSFLHITNKKVSNINDLKGLKMIKTTDQLALWAQAVGITPVQVFFQDYFTSLDKGLVNCVMGGYQALQAAGALEVLKYHAELAESPNMSMSPVIMNEKSWNSLPPDIQKIFEDQDEFAKKYMWENVTLTQEMAIDKRLRERGDTYTKIEGAEIQKWADAAKPSNEAWIENMESQGRPARALVAQLMKLLPKYK